MISKIMPATAERQRLIQNIVKSLRSKEPNNKRIEYYYTLKGKKRGSSFASEEQNGIFRDVSILHVNYSRMLFQGIEAVIENKTGKIFLENKPILMTAKRALGKIDEFLKKLQPENLEKRKYGIVSSEISGCKSDFERNMSFDTYEIKQHIVSSPSHEKSGPKEVITIF